MPGIQSPKRTKTEYRGPNECQGALQTKNKFGFTLSSPIGARNKKKILIFSAWYADVQNGLN